MLTLQSLPSNAYPLEPIPALLVLASPVLVLPPFLDAPFLAPLLLSLY